MSIMNSGASQSFTNVVNEIIMEINVFLYENLCNNIHGCLYIKNEVFSEI